MTVGHCFKDLLQHLVWINYDKFNGNKSYSCINVSQLVTELQCGVVRVDAA